MAREGCAAPNIAELDSTERGHLKYALAGALTKAYAGADTQLALAGAHVTLAKAAKFQLQCPPNKRKRPDYFPPTYARDFMIGAATGRDFVPPALKRQLDAKQQTGAVLSSAAPGTGKVTPVARYRLAVANAGDNIRLSATDPPRTGRSTARPQYVHSHLLRLPGPARPNS